MKEILQALLEGKKIELVDTLKTTELTTEGALRALADGKVRQLRVVPEKIVIGDQEIATPLRIAPYYNSTYFEVSIEVREKCWRGSAIEESNLRNGLLHGSHADAFAHKTALEMLTRKQ